MFVIPAFPRQREEECHEFKASLISTVYSRPARAANIARHHLRKQPPKHTNWGWDLRERKSNTFLVWV